MVSARSKTLIAAAVIAMAAVSFFLIMDEDSGAADAATTSMYIDSNTNANIQPGDTLIIRGATNGDMYSIDETTVSKPSWMTYSHVNGLDQIAGTAVAGNYTISYTYEYETGLPCTSSHSITVTAAPTYTTCYLTYDANGGIGGPGTVSVQSQTTSYTFTISSIAPTKSGSTFKGWNYSPTSTVALPTLSAGSQKTWTSDTTLYAVWQANPVTCVVSFDANGGGGSCSAQSALSGNSINLPSTGMTKAGYALAGWRAGSVSGTLYNTGASYTVTSNITMYAAWSQTDGNVDVNAPTAGSIGNAYTYTPSNMNVSGSVWVMWNEARYNNQSCTVMDSKPDWMTVTNLNNRSAAPTFAGTPTAAGTYIIKTHANHSSSSVVQLSTVTWTIVVPSAAPSVYTLTYNANGGTGSLADQTGQYNNAIQLHSDGMTRSGYKLAGWWINERGTDVMYPLGSIYSIQANSTARACWVPDSNIVIFDANGGTMSGGSTFAAYLSSTEGTVTLQASGLSRYGYTFGGWYKSTDNTTIYAPGYMYPTAATTTFCAYWIVATATKLTVTIDANGGSGGYSQYIEAGKKIMMPMYGVTKSGGELDGFTAGTLSGTMTAKGASTAAITSSTTYYAKWAESGGNTPATFTVSFDLKGGEGSAPVQTISGSGKATRPADPTRSEYVFNGWKLRGGASAFDFNTTLTSSSVIEAQWLQYYSVAVAGLKVTVTQKAHVGTSTTVTWWDGASDTGITGTFTHTFAQAGSGTLTVTTNGGDGEVYRSSSFLSVTGSGGPAPAQPYTITWVVDGSASTTEVSAGVMPSYEGSTAKTGHRFVGWSPAVVPANSNATYTAQYEQASGHGSIDLMTAVIVIAALFIGILLYMVFPPLLWLYIPVALIAILMRVM